MQALDLRANAQYGHYDGRTLVGPSVVPLYESVYATLDKRCGASSPLIFNDADQALEDWLQLLAESIDGDGSIVNAVTPIVDSFVNSGLGE